MIIDKHIVRNPVAAFFNRFSVKGHWYARLLYIIGVRMGVSSNICDELTYGYGNLGHYGDWKYPLFFEDTSFVLRHDEPFIYDMTSEFVNSLKEKGYTIEEINTIFLDEALNLKHFYTDD